MFDCSKRAYSELHIVVVDRTWVAIKCGIRAAFSCFRAHVFFKNSTYNSVSKSIIYVSYFQLLTWYTMYGDYAVLYQKWNHQWICCRRNTIAFLGKEPKWEIQVRALNTWWIMLMILTETLVNLIQYIDMLLLFASFDIIPSLSAG